MATSSSKPVIMNTHNSHIIIFIYVKLGKIYARPIRIWEKNRKLLKAIKTCTIMCSIQSGRLIPTALFFFFNIALVIWYLLCFLTNFKIFALVL